MCWAGWINLLVMPVVCSVTVECEIGNQWHKYWHKQYKIWLIQPVTGMFYLNLLSLLYYSLLVSCCLCMTRNKIYIYFFSLLYLWQWNFFIEFTFFWHPIADLCLCWGVIKHSFIHSFIEFLYIFLIKKIYIFEDLYFRVCSHFLETHENKTPRKCPVISL